MLNLILKGIITGFLSSYLITIGLRPSIKYPEEILEIIDNLWVFLIILLINYYIFIWDTTIGLLLLISIISLIVDIIIFTEGGFIESIFEKESNAKKLYDYALDKIDYSNIKKPVFSKCEKCIT